MTPQEKIEKLLRSKHEEITATASNHGAFNLRVFGSVARGEATENSDLDLLFDYSSEKTSPWFPMGLKFDLEELLGVSVDLGTVESLKESIREEVLAEAKPLSEMQ